ncbi:MAG: tetratricopeptide repeat protein [Chloroflexota bacterium]
MLSRQQFDAASFRLADYHLSLLKSLQSDFLNGKFHRRQEFETHWSQIKQSHQVMSDHLHADEVAASYCLNFVLAGYEILYAWRNLTEISLWVECGLIASEHLDNQGQVDLLHRQIGLYFVNQRTDLAQENIDQLLHIAEHDNDTLAKAHALLHRGRLHITQGEYDKAKADLSQSAKRYHQLGQTAQHGWTLHNLATVAESQSDFDTARQYLEEALDVYQAPQDLRRITLARSRLGSIIQQLGDQTLGFQYADQALKSAYQLQDNVLIISTLLNIAIVVWSSEQRTLSLVYYEEASLLSRKVGALPYLGNALMNIGYIHSEQGNFIHAEEFFTDAMNTYAKLQYDRRKVVVQSYLCIALLMNDKNILAMDYMRQAWQFATAIDDDSIYGLLAIAMVVHWMQEGKTNDANYYYHTIRANYPSGDVGDALAIVDTQFPDLTTRRNDDEITSSLADLYAHLAEYLS